MPHFIIKESAHIGIKIISWVALSTGAFMLGGYYTENTEKVTETHGEKT